MLKLVWLLPLALLAACAEPKPKSCKPPLPPHRIVERPQPVRHTTVFKLPDGTAVEEVRQ